MLNRDFVLKNFFNKVNECKRQNARELRFSANEVYDLSLAVSELLSEYFSKTIDKVKESDTMGDEEMTLDGGVFRK
jgi:hypothetical protein